MFARHSAQLRQNTTRLNVQGVLGASLIFQYDDTRLEFGCRAASKFKCCPLLGQSKINLLHSGTLGHVSSRTEKWSVYSPEAKPSAEQVLRGMDKQAEGLLMMRPHLCSPLNLPLTVSSLTARCLTACGRTPPPL